MQNIGSKHKLELVIVRIDFEKIDNFSKSTFEEAFEPKYSKNSLIEQSTETKEIWMAERRVLDQRNFPVYKYFDKQENSFAISDNFCFFEFKKYHQYESLKDVFLKALRILKDKFSLEIIDRMGFRYLDKIKPENENFENYISHNLLGNNKFFDDVGNDEDLKSLNTKKSRSLGRIDFKNNDNINTSFVFGGHNKNYPAPLSDEDFTMDFDSVCLNVDIDEVEEKLDKMHKIIKVIFKKSITERLCKEIYDKK